MEGRPSTTRKLVTVLSVVAVWVVFALITDNWWRKEMVTGVIVEGVGGLLALEVLGAIPHLLFFLLAGWCVYLFIGADQGLFWVVVSAGVTVFVKFVALPYSRGQLDLVSYAIILANYVLPFLFALGGAFLARGYLIRGRHREQAET